MPDLPSSDLPILETLRDLLTALAVWSEERDRRAFLQFALRGHPVLANLICEGKPLTVAAELCHRLHRDGYPRRSDGEHPVCCLIHETRRCGEDCESAVAERIAALARFFSCDAPPTVVLSGSPYPGLMAYDWGQSPDIAKLFVGREIEILDVLKALGRISPGPKGGLLVVTGASGSGKSSLVKAGVWRALADPEVDGSEPIPGCRSWAISAMTPTQDGDPFLGLINSLRSHCRQGRLRPAEEAQRLRDDPGTFQELLDRALGPDRPWLLILDQMEELFSPEAAGDLDSFAKLLQTGLADSRLRVIATLRADFHAQVLAHPVLLNLLKRGHSYPVGAPGPLALARMIEAPARATGRKVEPKLTERLVREADREPGGLALLAAALQDTWAAAEEDAATTLTLKHYTKIVKGLKGVFTRRGERGLEIVGEGAEAALPRVFGPLIHIDPETGVETRRRALLANWPEGGIEQRLIDVFSRDADRPQDAVRLLVCDQGDGRASVEVAHESLLREWPLLSGWIRTRRTDLIRRDEAKRDAARWDERGRPDHLLPHPELVAEVRTRLTMAGLWEDLSRDPRVAAFLVGDAPQDLIDLTCDAFTRSGDGGPETVLLLIATLTAQGRTWESTCALAAWVDTQRPELAAWLRSGLDHALEQLGDEDAVCWHRRRLSLGDLLAALGDDRPGVGVGADGLPDVDFVEVHLGRRPCRIGRHIITNAQYQAFVESPDYANPEWWGETEIVPDPVESNWPQPNRPRVQVSWVEARAFCSWLAKHARAVGRIGTDEVIRLPTEAEWELAATGGDGREYPWGDRYRIGHANVDETFLGIGPYNLGQTTAVGLYPRGNSPLGLRDCAGNVWEWCQDEFRKPGKLKVPGERQRTLRGGSWGGGDGRRQRGLARQGRVPFGRGGAVGFRVVCVESTNAE